LSLAKEMWRTEAGKPRRVTQLADFSHTNFAVSRTNALHRLYVPVNVIIYFAYMER